MVKYTNEMICTKEELSTLFLSVNWNSGKFPDKLYTSVQNSTYKIFAYDDDKLVGIITGLSDLCINLFISYLVVHPDYQKKKIGSTLIKDITSINSFNRIQLITDSSDKAFYLKNGFVEDGVGIFKINW